jgi:hypothetical protein
VCGATGVGFLVDRHQAHQPPDALFVHGMDTVLQMLRHLPDSVKRGVQKLPVDQEHVVEVPGSFTLWRS